MIVNIILSYLRLFSYDTNGIKIRIELLVKEKLLTIKTIFPTNFHFTIKILIRLISTLSESFAQKPTH